MSANRGFTVLPQTISPTDTCIIICWMLPIIIATIGFKEVVPLDVTGKMFTVFLSVTSVGVFAYAVTNNATLANNYMTRADERLREARFIDATENALGTIESNEFTDARL